MSNGVMDGAEPTYSAGKAAGVLLLHDLGGAPQTVKGLGDVLGAAGYAVDIPLLPGHGTSLEDLAAMVWDDWAAASQLALDELISRTGPVVVIGIGMGATLACWVAATQPLVSGVVAINPRTVPVPSEAIDMLRAMQADGAEYMQPLRPDVNDRTAQFVGYDTVPVSTLISMFEALGEMANHWHELTAPVLVISSTRDHRVSPYNADFLAEHAGGPVERLVLDRSFHLATLDVEHLDLERSVADFVGKVTGI